MGEPTAESQLAGYPAAALSVASCEHLVVTRHRCPIDVLKEGASPVLELGRLSEARVSLHRLPLDAKNEGSRVLDSLVKRTTQIAGRASKHLPRNEQTIAQLILFPDFGSQKRHLDNHARTLVVAPVVSTGSVSVRPGRVVILLLGITLRPASRIN